MAKLYVIGIGGTGSRVLKSLTMLMAAGVRVEDDKQRSYEIIPVIIDPDHAAADLTRTVKLMKDYSKVYNTLDHNSSNQNKFFGTKINMEIIPEVRLPLENTLDVDFKDYIGLPYMRDIDNLPNANFALVSTLFSQKNLDAKMEVGFKGNPNIGSVVLNQFALTKQWTDLVASFGQDDRIFVISSIFGGTGASGFPLLLKKIRSVDEKLPGCKNIKDSIIGAITVLPYFDVKPAEDSEIDSSTFMSKTKAALSYYDRNMTEANMIYYIGDKQKKQYENSEGGATQQNRAHFIELASALAIVDFARQSDLETTEGKPSKVQYKEFGIRDEVDEILFGNLDNYTNLNIKKPLVMFTMFCKYMKEQLADSVGKQPWSKDLKFDTNFVRSHFYGALLKDIETAYIQWLEEMADNSRAFTPFDLREKKNDVFALIKGVVPAKVFSFSSNYALFDDYLNKKQGKINHGSSKENMFVELFYTAINDLVKDKFRL
ncbi:MAG: hypothetical protein IJK92_05760 [Bacteroidales bacterium]|nr:hypothetical protein [Bacteroidales bacterium]